jgi:hypothetical protein
MRTGITIAKPDSLGCPDTMCHAGVPTVADAVLRLLAYCQQRDWSGHDPYDALNSPWLGKLPWADRRLPRLAFTQLLKRSPVNLRTALGIPSTQNPKALALFLSASLKLRRLGLLPDGAIPENLIARLVTLRSPNSKYYCWGYSFPWQTRKNIVPRGAPNLVCTIFVANALLDAYEDRQDARLLEMAVSSADYIVKELYFEDSTSASFSYPLPGLATKVHNANFLAAALLVRVSCHTHNQTLLEPALRASRYSASRQRPDGSWYYGELRTQNWIDNFHTGYNLTALRSIGRDLHTKEFEETVTRGFEFYLRHFFREDGAPRYFHNATYPIDIHCVAQSFITILDFSDRYLGAEPLIDRVYRWVMINLWDERGFFYYRQVQTMTIRISYMRWSQAWMLLALSSLAEWEPPVRSRPAHDRA